MDPFIGEIRIIPWTFAPVDWLFCQGQEVNVSDYQALYAVIGNIYGGTPGRTFKLPDLQAYAPMGQGQGPNLTNRTLGQPVGAISETLTEAKIPNHNHTAQATGQQADNADPTIRYFGKTQAASINTYSTLNTALVQMSPLSLGVMGGGQPHENRQPRLGVNFIMAYNGIFPIRP